MSDIDALYRPFNAKLKELLGEATKKELPPHRSLTSESQGQSVFPIKTLDGGCVGEDVSKTMQNEEATKKEDDRNVLDSARRSDL